MSGTEAGMRAVLAALRSMPEVEGVIEIEMDEPLQQSDDSSPAGLRHDAPPGFHEIEIRVPDSVAYDHVHGRVETLASDAGIAVEWLKRSDPMDTSSILIDERQALDVDSPVSQPVTARGAGVGWHGSRRRQAEAAPVETTDQILGSMVHAISNALNSILSTSQLANLLMTQRRMDEARISLNRIEEECLRASRLLRDGRSLATLKVPESVGGADVVVQLDACAAACSGFGDVRVKCDRPLPLVHGQPDALKRMFVEILDNAFQFGAHGVVVVVRREDGGGAVRIEFRDDGPGIRIQSRTLFESFVSSEPEEHSGLGLAFAAQIAAAYGGAIGLDDSSDGAVFWVRLPFEADSYPAGN